MSPHSNYMNDQRFHTLLGESQYDAVIATSLQNVYYLSGALIETQIRIPLRLAIVVWPRDGEPTLIVGDIEEDLARRDSSLTDIRPYVEFQQSPIAALATVLKEKGLLTGRLGVEFNHLITTYYQELVGLAPNIQLLSADHFFSNVRLIKSASEIELLTQAAQITEASILSAYRATVPGVSEKEVAWKIMSNLFDSGADSMRFLVLGAGENSVYSHHNPTQRKLQENDIVRLDVGAYFNGYASDIARMAFVGEPTAAQSELYRKMHDIHLETMQAIRAGVLASDVYRACQSAFASRDLHLSMPHVGHGSGVGGGHEEPILNPHNDTCLEAGMVLSVEPVYHDNKLGGYHIEDLILVTEQGYQLLSNQMPTAEPFIIRDEANFKSREEA